MVSSNTLEADGMRSISVGATGLALCLTLALLAGFPGAQTLLAASPLDRYESGDRSFSEFEIGDLKVFWHQRMIGGAFVENDFIVYQFDRTTDELLDVKSHWREDLPGHLPSGLLPKAEALALVTGEVEGCRLYFISPESDVYPIEPPPENPCWVVRHIVDGDLKITVIDARTGAILGNGVPPPYEGFSLTGPWESNPCSGGWISWKENARSWFETMGYSTQAITWPTQDEVKGHVQSCETAMFYELAHGSSTSFASGCLGGSSYEMTYASEIESWIADYPKMPFAFIGSCGGLCWKFDGTFAYEFRKGEPDSTTVVGYCDMAEPQCALCWDQSILWQTALFNYMSQGWTVWDAFTQAGADYPACGDSSCMRFAGDKDFAVVPVVRRDPWPPTVQVIQPNGGETLESGTIYEITWEIRDNGPVDSVAVLLSLDGGLTYPDTLATGEPADSQYLWTVPDIDSKTARIRVAAVDRAMNQGEDESDFDFVLWGTTSGAEGAALVETPAEVMLDIMGSNPISAGCRVRFGMPVPGRMRLALYDAAGRCVYDLLAGQLEEGFHTVVWSGKARDGSRLGPGLYFLRLETAAGATTAKAVVAR
jgi:hypothetical protein